MFLGLLLRFWAAVSFESIFWPDEIFQTLEQAHRLVFGVGIIPWEFQVGTRSYFFPGFLALFLLPFRFLAVSSSFQYTMFIKVVLCFFSGGLIIYAYKFGKEFGLRYAGILAAIFTAFWYELVYFAPKALSSVFASYLILPGLFYAAKAIKDQRLSDALLAGIFLSLAVAIRFQYAVFWLVPLLFFIGDDYQSKTADFTWRYLLPSAVILLSWGILDWAAFGLPFHSPLVKTYQDMVLGVAGQWGVMPLNWYAGILFNNLGMILPLGVMFSVMAFPRMRMACFCLLVVFLLHSLIGHKEYRYIFVVIPLLFTVMAVGIDVMIAMISRQSLKILTVLLVVSMFIFLSLDYAPGYSYERVGYEFTNKQIGRRPLWNSFRENILAYRYLSTRDDVWGVQDNIAPMEWSGGYYHLHHDVPIYNLRKITQKDIFDNKYANFVISRDLLEKKGLRHVTVVEGVHIYKKPNIKERRIDPGYTMKR